MKTLRNGVIIVLIALFAFTTFVGADDEGAGGSDEESATQYSLDETYDEVRRGVSLVLDYDSNRNAFVGKVTNGTDAKIGCVRVEVHLSNGTELGPTPAKNLRPGASHRVRLSAAGESNFKTYSAHPESGCGGSGEGEGRGEHSGEGEGRGEHGKKAKRGAY